MNKHSPTPWRVENINQTYHVDAADGSFVALFVRPADAALIVEAAMADAVGKAVKAIDPHALPPFHEEYAVKMHGHVWKGDSEEDFELLKTYEGARKIVERMEAEDVMQGFWDHPAREIVRRVAGEWEDA